MDLVYQLMVLAGSVFAVFAVLVTWGLIDHARSIRRWVNVTMEWTTQLNGGLTAAQKAFKLTEKKVTDHDELLRDLHISDQGHEERLREAEQALAEVKEELDRIKREHQVKEATSLLAEVASDAPNTD